ncbi:hypothetical protein C3V39_02130 [Prevotella sp. oral taxon 820]|nr:hypothetical protein C3V39_02130 [Prevotella sp. oral taxon 820]
MVGKSTALEMKIQENGHDGNEKRTEKRQKMRIPMPDEEKSESVFRERILTNGNLPRPSQGGPG